MTRAQVAAKKAGDASVVFDHVEPRGDVVVPIANGEAVSLVSAMEQHGGRLLDVRLHQMHALHDHPYLHGEVEGLRHISYFLSPIGRRAFQAGTIDLVPASFSEVPALMHARRPMAVLAAASPVDRHGYFSLGVGADYTTGFVGRCPFVLEVNHAMPRTAGRNEVHISQVAAWVEVDRPLIEVLPPTIRTEDRRIASYIAERVPDGATVQTGIGAIPNAVLEALRDHRDLGVHTELVSDGVMDLIERGVVTGVHKSIDARAVITTFALGSADLHRFIDGNPVVEFWPVEYVNDPRVIGRQPSFVSINATLEVDLLGQCASETLGGKYYSGSGGQPDFARGAHFAEGGQGFIVLHSSARDGQVSRIVPRLAPGSVVTTNKNLVDHVVTEYGVAELRGKTVRERSLALIGVAGPQFREELLSAAKEMGYL